MSALIPYTYGNFPTYRFYIAYVPFPYAYAVEVFPLNFLETSLVDELEGDNIFYRRKFNGSLLFGTNSLTTDVYGVIVNRQDDWVFFWDIEQNNPCAKIYFHITKTITGVTTTYWDGYFSTTDGKFDIDKCTFEVTPIVNDTYVDLLDHAELQQNILSVTPVVTTIAYVAGHINISYTRNRWLFDVIEYLAGDAAVGIVPGVTVSSHFFTDSPNNPVSLNENYLLYLTIAQKSDIIRPTSSNPATTAMMSWNELMDILWAMFQVRWNYDSGTNTINVEHVSWTGFAPGVGIDLRLQPACVASNKYIYLKDKMPKYEKFSFMEADQVNFVRSEIWYDSPCVNQDPKSNTVETIIPVTTDLNYIIDNSSPTETNAISDEGFVILANYLYSTPPDVYRVALQCGAYTQAVRLNMHLSWANLQYFYFRHNRVLINGYMNADYWPAFVSAQKTKLQECSAIVCDVFDPTEKITTELGYSHFGDDTDLGNIPAIVQRAELKPDGSIKLNLLYGPADNANPGVTPDKVFLLVQQSDCLTWYATFPEPVNQAGGIDIQVRYLIYDSADNLLHTCQDVWNVPDTSRESNYTIDPATGSCSHVMNAGDYLDISFPTNPSLHGWVADTEYDTDCVYP
jgi:hypothetical protein